MNRILAIFKIRPGEERISALLIGLMLFTAAGSAIGGNATEALFFARFGVELLPSMYMILGLTSFLTSMMITVIIGRIPRQRLFVLLPLVIGITLIAEWLVIPFNLKWFFAFMWLGMNVIGSLQGLLTWGLAGAACDTRQAKRLFPLFSAGGILGSVLGGFATSPLASWLHSENLLLVWAGALFVSYFLGRVLIGSVNPLPPTTSSRTRQPGVIVEMQRGYQFVRHSTLMHWISYSAILFSVCFFSLKLFFSRGATVQFPDADQLAGFLGQFQSWNTAIALMASLFLANRLFVRFGIMPMLLLFSVIYLLGFGVLAISAPFALLIAARFAQMIWLQGIADPAWQSIFNVVPPERRDQVRAFVGGVPEQAGTIIAGILLLVGEQLLRPEQLFWIGLAAAALLMYTIWRASLAYSGALVEALRSGQPQLFFSEIEPFGGFRTDSEAVVAAIHGLDDENPSIRRISTDILGHLSIPEAEASLVRALADDDGMVRASALRGLSRSEAITDFTAIIDRLRDTDADVRLEAVDAMNILASSPREFLPYLEPLLEDNDPRVRAKTASTLIRLSDHAVARKTLHEMVKDSDPWVRIHALNALEECKDDSAFDLAVLALGDNQAIVRKTAPKVLVSIHPQQAISHMIQHLNDDDPSVIEACAKALSQIGLSAIEPLLEVVIIPGYEDGALNSLNLMPVQIDVRKIRSYAKAAAGAALYYNGLVLGLKQKFGQTVADDGRNSLLIESLYRKAQHSGLNALQSIGLIKNREAIAVAVDNLRSGEAAQRANAIETLETIGEREIIHPLLALWESGEYIPPPLPDHWLLELIHEPDSWLRACAVLVAVKSQTPEICEALQALAQSDSDSFIRDLAEKALTGETKMDTLATLSLMERILFLRRVSIFSDLPPADLKQVAGIMQEAVFSDNEILTHQGDPGDEMYIIVSGEVRVIVAHENAKESHEVARRLSGDYVGEMAIISREPRIASLVAAGPVRTLCINQRHFESLVRERPEISLGVMRVLCQRLREANRRSEN